jgi:hypothetical protein
MPLQATSGAASYDAFGGGVAAVPNYIEDVFSTWLYTGNGSTQTITNGIDLAGKGGLFWGKQRNSTGRHWLLDNARGGNILSTNLTDAQTAAFGSSPFTSTGLSFTSANSIYNASGSTYASWTFRKQPKFFDVVTYTGNGVAGRTVSHSLGSVPGMIVVKSTSAAANWVTYHRSLGNDYAIYLDMTEQQDGPGKPSWNFTNPTSTEFTVAENGWNTNNTGTQYVAYIFAHNAGGFGLTGTDNVISCGSFTSSGSVTTVNLGYEPQWVLFKQTNSTGNWTIADNMRGMPASGSLQALSPNLSNAEEAQTWISTTSTGFTFPAVSGFNMIYIAIRRGPMKVPTTGTSVLGLNARAGTGANATVTGSAGVTDLAIIKRRNGTANWVWVPRLTGTGYLSSNATTAETAAGTTILQDNPWDVMDGVKVGTTSTLTNASGSTFINYLIDRAPGFMDVVCYTGTGANLTLAHNLTVKPELALFKRRSGVDSWVEFHDMNASTYSYTFFTAGAAATQPYGAGYRLQAQPSATSLYLNDYGSVNTSGATYVAYLFASCPGVSKVGSYTGNGGTQTINCGFTGGARFVLIKNTGAAESWHIFDTARGMVAGTDPRLRVNTTDSEINNNWVYTATTGFELVTSDAAVNSTGNNYIFLAIA